MINPVPSWTKKDLALVAILTIIALVLRIIGLNGELQFDEIVTLVRYIRLPAWEIIGQYGGPNNHMLYSLLAHTSIGWFGESAWSIRLPAVVFGVATIPAAYYLGRQLASRNEAFLATAFLAVSYHHIWFSQSARGYTGLLLGTVLVSIFFIRLLTLEKPGYRTVLAYGIVAALATLVHLTAALVVIAHGITWLAVISGQVGKSKPDLKPAALLSMFLAGLFSMALYAPVLLTLGGRAPVLLTLGGLYKHSVITAAEPDVWTTSGWVLSEFVHAMNNATPGGWPVIALVVLVIATGTWACLKRGVVVTGILILPLLVTLAFVIWFSSVIYPRFLFSSVVFFLLIAVQGGYVLSRAILPMISIRQVTVIGLIVALATATMVPGAWKPKQDFAAAMAFVNERRIADDAVVCLGLTYLPLHEYLGMDCFRVLSASKLAELEQIHSRTWVVYTLPVLIQEGRPDMWSKIQKDYSPVTRFRGTLGGGDITIMLNAPAIEAE